jgi:hypothetical protein
LSDAAARVWTDVLRDWDLDAVETTTLERACRALTMAQRLDAVVDADGAMVPGSTGRLRLHPAIAEARAASETAVRLLARLDLSEAVKDATSLRGQKAARARWAQERERRLARGA